MKEAGAMPPITTHQDLTDMPVVEVMSHPVVAVTAASSLGEALTTMLAAGVRHLGVLDDGGRCRGVLTDRAIAAAWAVDPSALDTVPAGRLLDRRPAVVGVDATLGDVARTMYHDAVDAAAVIDRAGRAVGIVTGADLIGAMARHVAPATNDPGHQDLRPDADPPEGTV